MPNRLPSPLRREGPITFGTAVIVRSAQSMATIGNPWISLEFPAWLKDRRDRLAQR